MIATTTVFADIVRNVGGDRVTVESIIPAGVGPEDYEPKPDDARRLADADLIVSNGVGLDDFLGKLLGANASATPGSSSATGSRRSTWTAGRTPTSGSIRRWSATTTCRRSQPAGATRPGRRGDLRGERRGLLAAAHRPRRRADGEGGDDPGADRKLVTFHDAFPYFARHFGFELVGVVLANVGQDPTAGDLARLVEKVKAAHVRAVFCEAQFSPKLSQTLADEAGIGQVVDHLYNDALGPAPADTYLGLMRWNVDQVVAALTRPDDEPGRAPPRRPRRPAPAAPRPGRAR